MDALIHKVQVSSLVEMTATKTTTMINWSFHLCLLLTILSLLFNRRDDLTKIHHIGQAGINFSLHLDHPLYIPKSKTELTMNGPSMYVETNTLTSSRNTKYKTSLYTCTHMFKNDLTKCPLSASHSVPTIPIPAAPHPQAKI